MRNLPTFASHVNVKYILFCYIYIYIYKKAYEYFCFSPVVNYNKLCFQVLTILVL